MKNGRSGLYKKIELVFGEEKVEAFLNDSTTARKLLKILPLKSEVSIWGNELYFEIPLEADLENGKELMEPGNIAFWPSGNTFCVFYGPTPIGDGSQPRAISPVTVIGKVTDENGLEKLKKIKPSDLLEVRLSESR